MEVHVNGNPQLVVQLPPQSTTRKTLGVMIDKDVPGKLALPQFQCDGKMTVFVNHYPECLVCRTLRRELNH